MPGLAIGLLLYLIGLAVSWVADRIRRLSGAYRRGYALVAVDSQVGAEIRPDQPFQMAVSPLFLPPGAGILPVAIVRDAERVRSNFRDRGLVWVAGSARVEEVLPSWTGLGPNGGLVLDVIQRAAFAPPDRLDTAATPTVSNKDLLADEPRRAWPLRSLAELTDWIVYDRLRQEVLGDPPKEVEPEELEEEIVARQGPGWLATRRIATVAALAASELETLPDRHLISWTKPWVDLTHPPDWIHPTTAIRTRAAWKLGAVTDLIARWPTVFAVLTVVLIAVVFAVNFLVGMVASVLGIGGLSVALLRRPRRSGRWRPDATLLERATPAGRLQRAMAGIRRTSHPMFQLWLYHLLPGARVWAAVDAVEPTDPGRWLDWLDGNGEQVPLRTFEMADGRRAALVFTERTEHRVTDRHLHIHWTMELDWDRTVRAANTARCSLIIIDAGQSRGIEVSLQPPTG